MPLKNRVAVVTGASRGIGRCIAGSLAAEGARLVLNARGDKGLGDIAPDAEVVTGDVGDEAVAARLVKAAVDRWGRLDILVNNAGVGHPGLMENLEPADFDRLMRTNLRGPYLLMRAAIPVMRRQKEGFIVNIGSLAGVNPVPNQAAYAASKWALLGLSRSVMGEVRQDNIRILTVEPGSTMTDFGLNPEKLAKGPKLVQPQDVADITIAALKLPGRATISEIEIRPTNPA